MTRKERVAELEAGLKLAQVNNDVPNVQLYRRLLEEHKLIDEMDSKPSKETSTNAVPKKTVLTKAELEKKTVPVLKEMAQDLGVDTDGMLKADLVDALQNE